MTQAELARYLGMTESTVARLETGQRRLSPAALRRIQRLFDS
jgi:transcriptional regulator with XRE-family HTH domain